jgi:hypothetical protein
MHVIMVTVRNLAIYIVRKVWVIFLSNVAKKNKMTMTPTWFEPNKLTYYITLPLLSLLDRSRNDYDVIRKDLFPE